MRVLLILSILLSTTCTSYSSQVRNYILKVVTPSETSGGTGFFLKTSKGTYIITNAHVCREYSVMHLVIHEIDHVVVGKVILADHDLDLCAIKAKGNGLRLSKSGVRCSEYVTTMGYPGLGGFKVSSGQQCNGVFMSKVIPGQSGSPVLDLDGYVVGVIEAQFPDTQMGYFIPESELIEFLRKVEK